MTGWELLNDPAAIARLRVSALAHPVSAVTSRKELLASLRPGVDAPLEEARAVTIPDIGRYGSISGVVHLALPRGEAPASLYGAVLMLDGDVFAWSAWDDGFLIPDDDSALKVPLLLEIAEAGDVSA